MQLVIIAGGKGTRLGLKTIPKPMCKIHGKPLLEWQILFAKRFGVEDIFILSGHLHQVIEDYFLDGKDFGVNIHHIVEPFPLGTAGSLKIIEKKLDERFLVFYGDVVLDFDLSAFIAYDQKHVSSLGTLIVHPTNHPDDSDLVQVDASSKITAFLSKPHAPDVVYKNLSNAAVYILSKEIFKYINDNQMQDFGRDIFTKINYCSQELYAYDTAEYIRDMGTPNRLARIEEDMRSGLVSRLNKKNPRPAIFLDRDGTINEDMGDHPCCENFRLINGAVEAIRLINQMNYLAIVITNQPTIAKGFQTYEELQRVHNKLETILGKEGVYLDGIFYCPHHPERGFQGEIESLKIDCECRKPKPGLFFQAAEKFNIDLKKSWMLGDSLVDIQAGIAAGCKSLRVSSEFSILDAVKYIEENDNYKDSFKN